MENVWGPFGFWLRVYVGLISLWGIQLCWSLNDEGLALLKFQERITSDPFRTLANWNPNDSNPCRWSGVHCVDDKVQKLVIAARSLEGTLGPELGKLSHLKSLVLYKNNFYGTIPKELGDLDKLELLDLRGNHLTGCIPTKFRGMLLSAQVLVCDSKIEGSDSQQVGKPGLPSNDNPSTPFTTLSLGKIGKYTHWSKQGSQTCEEKYCDYLTSSDKSSSDQNEPDLANLSRRNLLDQPSNLAAAPYSGPVIQISSIPFSQSSGAFPAVPDANKKQNESLAPSAPPAPLPSTSDSPHTNGASGKLWELFIIIAGIAVLIIVLVVMLCFWKKRAAKVIKPWKTGISGQLQKAFITGVPKLNRAELETACEDFSNIINSFDACTIYKGTLSSGVEIAVDSTIVSSVQDWSKSMETSYRKKIATLSRVNHKNFTNLIGYCDEEQPFTRMMVFEYAPNGNLFEHLHVKEVEPLDWSARMRVIMGISYCLQYMHHDLNPPVAHSNLNSVAILLTDDFAAKISEISFGKNVSSATTGAQSQKSELPPPADPETDVYNFGVLLLEIISAKLPYSEEQGHLVTWAAEYLNDKQSINNLIDPTLESFKEEELEVIREVIKDCIQPDSRLRPTMKDITPRLREVLRISPEQAVPRLSPLWWAELEILSLETT